jgi:hypothetical protein
MQAVACAVGDLFDANTLVCVAQQQCGKVMMPPEGTVAADDTTPFCDELISGNERYTKGI